ncbi:hypothetical protein ACFPYI_04745 [Halomarina salina]|uniref:Uncharacterized protein n=1 Tax=Halomarina salina TaxID=1872699 RepID=A0ABD5RJY8_9EURY|nr:hypothetical protein [Halomarina salina]
MRLADDTRGRVPFALLGVVLLVTSATVATTQFGGPTATQDLAVDRAMREATATTQTALREAVADAARDAARNPVTQRAPTAYGRVLNDSETFEDALRVRIYLAAREHLGAVSATAGPVTADPALPGVDSPADLRAAKRRVHVSRAGPNGTALRVRIEGVQVRASRAERMVGEKHVAPTVTVASPVLELHDRVERFEERLDAGVTSPGFGQRFTAGMYALAWVRGAAQYRGAPVASVVGNQHVALAANDAVLGVQRATLGDTDSRSDEALAAAWARALATDLAPGSIPGPVVEETLDEAERGVGRLDGSVRNETVDVSPTAAADRALAASNETTLDRIVRRSYAVDTRVVSAVSSSGVTTDGDSRPGPNWTRVDAATRTERTVAGASSADTPTANVPTDWRTFRRYDRRVTVREVTTTRWRRGDETTTTTSVRASEHRVSLAVVGRHSPESRVARRGVDGVYEERGALGGPNLQGVPSAAVDRVVTDRGGADALARRAVGGTLDGDAVRVLGDRPAGLRSRLDEDIAALDRRVRNVSVTLPQVDVGTYAVSPPARLAARIRAKRGDLIDAPATYDGMADRTRVAVRRAYLDSLLDSLDARAEERRETRSDLDESLGERGSSLADVRRSLDVATDDSTDPGPVGSTDGLGGPLGVTVDTAPSYLTLDPVARERFGDGAGSVTPLDARNLNWVTVPYGDGAGWFARLLAGPERVSLRSAAGTLRASGRFSNSSATDREALRGEVRDGVAFVRGRLARTLADEGVCGTTSDCRGVVTAGLGRWETPAARALALANGSAAERVTAAASVSGGEERLAATLRTTTREALREDGARPTESSVSPVSEGNRAALRGAARQVATDAGEEATNRVLQRVLNRTLDDVPLGLPVAPVPGYWYATLNGWSVSVRGTYERLTVRSRRGARDTTYVRDGSAVAIDVDGNGERERLGVAPRVSFEASTTVVVVVPAGNRGVADVDGTRDERSPGYD